MLRATVAVLIVANLLFFAWARGWLAPVLQPPHQGEREPERLAAQLRPETIRVLPPQAAANVASAAVAKAVVCLEAGPFSDADIGIAEASLLGAGVSASAWTRDQVQLPATWLVYMGRFGDTSALRAKLDELKHLKLNVEELRAPPELAPGLVLSRHDSEAAASDALAQLALHGVRTARVVALPPPPLQHWLRATGADADLQARLLELKPPAFGGTFVPCQAAR